MSDPIKVGQWCWRYPIVFLILGEGRLNHLKVQNTRVGVGRVLLSQNRYCDTKLTPQKCVKASQSKICRQCICYIVPGQPSPKSRNETIFSSGKLHCLSFLSIFHFQRRTLDFQTRMSTVHEECWLPHLSHRSNLSLTSHNCSAPGHGTTQVIVMGRWQ